MEGLILTLLGVPDKRQGLNDPFSGMPCRCVDNGERGVGGGGDGFQDYIILPSPIWNSGSWT